MVFAIFKFTAIMKQCRYHRQYGIKTFGMGNLHGHGCHINRVLPEETLTATSPAVFEFRIFNNLFYVPYQSRIPIIEQFIYISFLFHRFYR